VEQLGGPPTPAVGWAAGIERILLAAGEAPGAPAPRVYLILDQGGDRRAAFALLRALRSAGVAAQIEQAGRSLKGQLKQADRLGAHFAAIFAADSVSLRDMGTGDQDQLDAETIVARALAVS
nr:histidine--tRNA ligase [Thermoleophilaceae bacterium]